MIGHICLYRPGWRVKHSRVPAKVQNRIVIPIVRITLPITRQPNGIGSAIKTAILHKFGTQSALHTSIHELVELTIEDWTDFAFDRGRIDRNGGLRGVLSPRTLRHEGGEKQDEYDRVLFY